MKRALVQSVNVLDRGGFMRKCSACRQMRARFEVTSRRGKEVVTDVCATCAQARLDVAAQKCLSLLCAERLPPTRRNENLPVQAGQTPRALFTALPPPHLGRATHRGRRERLLRVPAVGARLDQTHARHLRPVAAGALDDGGEHRLGSKW